MRSSQGYPQNSKLRGMRRRTAAVLGPGGAGSDRAYARRGAANSAPTGWSCVACPKQKHILHIVMCAVIASCSAVVSLHAMHTIKYSHWVLNEELGIIEPAFTAAAREALLKPRSEDRSTSGANTGAGTLGYSDRDISETSPHDSQLPKDGVGVGAMGAMNPLVQPTSADPSHTANASKKRSMPEPALAVLFDRYGGVDKALDALKHSAASNPRDPVILSDLGNAYRVKGDSEKAIECFEAALRIMPHPDFYLNLGGVFFALGELEEAVQMFTAGLQLNPVHALLQFSLGGVYAVLGRKEDAMRAFQATLRIQPDFDPASQYLAQLEAETRKPWWRLGCIGWIVVAAFSTVLVAAQRAVHWFVMQKPAQEAHTSARQAPHKTNGRQAEHGKLRQRRGTSS
mmetsp:Transcript_30156/g.76006  ORF Transcript_30156/g.76006 Transcript_30156/m.76006 type:complete len:400 (+) Transcript_30156:268-1467(+)